jgi:hypothetical protein
MNNDQCKMTSCVLVCGMPGGYYIDRILVGAVFLVVVMVIDWLLH